MTKSKSKTGSLRERTVLLERKKKLEVMITNNQGDEKALQNLRSDYRKVCDELEKYYDDIPLKQQD